MDSRAHLRIIPFPVVADALGIDLSPFKHRSGEWHGPCPIHGSKKNANAFHYNDDGRFNCFSEGCKGRGALDLVMAVKKCNITAATEFLQPLVGKEPAQAKKPHHEAAVSAQTELKPFNGASYRKFERECEWLTKRVPDKAIRELYGCFFYSNPARKSAFNNRVMIPIRDVDGQLFGYLGRSIPAQDTEQDGQQPKYLFPRDFPKTRFLFGADVLKAGTFGQLPLRVCYVVESPFAVMKFACYGLPAVSPFGWSVSPQQLEVLKSLAKGICYLPDRNKRSEAQNYMAALLAVVWTRSPHLPEGIDDPEHLTREQILAL